MLSYKTFKKLSPASKKWIYETVFTLRSNQISIQNHRIGFDKLDKILRATFKLSNSVGFHAMSLRQLSKESGISIGGLYSYIGSKTELANLIEHVLTVVTNELIELAIKEIINTKDKLIALIYSHIYLSEQLQPWFYFVYMESKSLSKAQKNTAKKTELAFEYRLTEIIKKGIKENLFKEVEIKLITSTTMAMMQDWHLKRWKHKKRNISPDEYAQFVANLLILQLKTDA